MKVHAVSIMQCTPIQNALKPATSCHWQEMDDLYSFFNQNHSFRFETMKLQQNLVPHKLYSKVSVDRSLRLEKFLATFIPTWDALIAELRPFRFVGRVLGFENLDLP